LRPLSACPFESVAGYGDRRRKNQRLRMAPRDGLEPPTQ
jgi:hypothetical protein